jgi:hypothetical protein
MLMSVLVLMLMLMLLLVLVLLLPFANYQLLITNCCLGVGLAFGFLFGLWPVACCLLPCLFIRVCSCLFAARQISPPHHASSRPGSLLGSLPSTFQAAKFLYCSLLQFQFRPISAPWEDFAVTMLSL